MVKEHESELMKASTGGAPSMQSPLITTGGNTCGSAVLISPSVSTTSLPWSSDSDSVGSCRLDSGLNAPGINISTVTAVIVSSVSSECVEAPDQPKPVMLQSPPPSSDQIECPECQEPLRENVHDKLNTNLLASQKDGPSETPDQWHCWTRESSPAAPSKPGPTIFLPMDEDIENYPNGTVPMALELSQLKENHPPKPSQRWRRYRNSHRGYRQRALEQL